MTESRAARRAADASSAVRIRHLSVLASFGATVAYMLMPVFGALSLYGQWITPSAGTTLRNVAAFTALASIVFAITVASVRPLRVALAVAPALALAFGLYSTVGSWFRIRPGTWADSVFACAYAMTWTVLVIIIKGRSDTFVAVLTQALGAMSAVMAVTSLASVIPLYGIRLVDQYALDPLPVAEATGRRDLPDVYQLIFDGLGRPDVLRAQYGIDLARIVEALRARGFDIADRKGIANYNQTYLSLASVLNATYLEELACEMGDRYSREPLHHLIQHSRVLEWFKKTGYEFVMIGGGYSATETHRLADECDCETPFISEFESVVVGSSLLRVLKTGGLDHVPHRRRVLAQLSRLETIEPAKRPRIVVAHLLAPHPPFVLGAKGEPRHPRRIFAITDGITYPGTDREYIEGYRAQTEYIASRLTAIIDHLQRISPRGAVIMVHGDHGPRLRFDTAQAERTDPRESVPIFLAVRWPPGISGSPRHVISLVNLYREYFRRYVDPSTEWLEDRAFVSSFAEPYRLLEVPLEQVSQQRIAEVRGE